MLHGLSSERKCLFSSAYLPFLASPSDPPDSGSYFYTRWECRNSLDGSIILNWRAQVGKITDGLRSQCCAAAANSCRRSSFSLGPVHSLGLADDQALTFEYCCLPIAGQIELRVLSFMCAASHSKGLQPAPTMVEQQKLPAIDDRERVTQFWDDFHRMLGVAERRSHNSLYWSFATARSVGSKLRN